MIPVSKIQTAVSFLGGGGGGGGRGEVEGFQVPSGPLATGRAPLGFYRGDPQRRPAQLAQPAEANPRGPGPETRRILICLSPGALLVATFISFDLCLRSIFLPCQLILLDLN